MPLFRLFAMGELRLLGDGEPVLPGRRKDLVLLVYLAQRSPQPVSRAELAALLWGEKSEARARQSLRQALADLRQALRDGIEITADHARLFEGAVELDVARFEADLLAGRNEVAVAAWQGEFLAGTEELGGEALGTWVTVERERLRRLLAAALERLVAGAERQGDWGAAARWAERWARAEPLAERPHTRWLEMLRLAGRPAEAAAAHAGFVARVRRELEVEPSPGFQRLAGAAAASAPASPALFTPDLVGRGRAFSCLLAAWQEVGAGTGAAVVVQGDIGIGKSRLCEEFLRWVTEFGGEALLLRSRAFEAEHDLSWSAARDLLAGLAEAPGLSGAPDMALAELGELVPGIRVRFPRLPAPDGVEPGMAGALIRVLADTAAEQPVLLFLDDFPAADESSRRLLLSLVRRLPARVLVLLTAGAGADTALEPLRGVGGVRWVRLQALDVSEVEMLLGSMLAIDGQTRHGLSRRLYAEGGGNPLYTVALVSALADAGHLVPDPAGVWRLVLAPGAALPLPADVRDALRARLGHLSPGAREVIGAAAVLARRIEPELLEAVSGLAPEEFCDAVDELVARRLLSVSPAPERGYEFAHELIRRVTDELLSPARRRLLQRRALMAARAPDRAGEAVRAREPSRRPARLLPGSSRLPGSRRAPLTALAVAAVLVGAAWLLQPRGGPGPAPLVAIGQIHDFTGGDSTLVLALADLLATNLSRADALQVVSSARMHELVAPGDSGPGAVTAAARRVGATVLVEGALHGQPDGTLRLDLRHVDPRAGAVRGSHTVTGTDAFQLIDEATQHLLAELGVVAGPLRVADVTTRSPVAARFYAEGLRAFYQGDRSAAHRLFGAALQEDSSFAMAAYYAAESTAADFRLHMRYLARAHALADHAAEPQRLLIRGRWADLANDPARLAIAETLAIRYPHDPDGHHLLGRARLWNGDFLRAISHLRRVVELDTLSLTAEQPRCQACEAYLDILGAYAMADSLEAAARTAREWMARVPGSAAPMQALGMILERTGCPEEAMQLRERAFALQPSSVHGTLPILRAACSIVRGDFEHADRLLRVQAAAGVPAERKQALWYLMISLRHQGRLQEALAASHEYRAMSGPSAEPDDWIPYEAITQAIVLFEMGRHREAAAVFDSLSWYPRQEWLPRRSARRRAWLLTHAATALHAAGDTGALRHLADTIRAQGAMSALGRDRLLHHHVTGLLHSARGRPAEAEAAFRQAVFSPTLGYTRTNLEWARALMRLGRHAEAIAVLQSALRGPLEASNLYVTRTELHEALAEAFSAAGRPDSAALHYRRVARAWEHADPLFHERRDRARDAIGRPLVSGHQERFPQ